MSTWEALPTSQDGAGFWDGGGGQAALGASTGWSAAARETPPEAAHTLGFPQYPIGHTAFPGIDESQIAGEVTPEKLALAVGHYADPVVYGGDGARDDRRAQVYERAELNEWDREHPDATDAQRSAAKIGASGAGAAPMAYDTSLGDLDSAEGRVRALNMITQNRDPNDPDRYDRYDKVDCGPASMVAGVLYAQGSKGVEVLLNDMKNDLPDGMPESRQVKAVRDKLAKGESLTVGDIQNIQHDLYVDMKEGREGAKAEDLDEAIAAPDDARTPDERRKALALQQEAFVKGSTMREFMNDHPDLKEMFMKNHLAIGGIDTDGDGKENHAVLDIGDGSGQVKAVYNPGKTNGKHGQITNQQDDPQPFQVPTGPTLDDYQAAEVGGHLGAR